MIILPANDGETEVLGGNPSKLPVNPNLEPRGSEPIVQRLARYDCTLTPIWSPDAIRPVPIPISMISATNLHRRPKALIKFIIVTEADSYRNRCPNVETTLEN